MFSADGSDHYFAAFFAGECARELRRCLDAAGENPQDWTLTWCPRSPVKYLETGFDQGEEVCRRMAKLLGCRCASLLAWEKFASEQKELDARARRENARDTLILRTSKIREGMKVLLFDDIITTGSTICAAADILHRSGASAVFPVALARTYPEAGHRTGK